MHPRQLPKGYGYSPSAEVQRHALDMTLDDLTPYHVRGSKHRVSGEGNLVLRGEDADIVTASRSSSESMKVVSE